MDALAMLLAVGVAITWASIVTPIVFLVRRRQDSREGRR
jgi:hypothetical protein